MKVTISNEGRRRVERDAINALAQERETLFNETQQLRRLVAENEKKLTALTCSIASISLYLDEL